MRRLRLDWLLLRAMAALALSLCVNLASDRAAVAGNDNAAGLEISVAPSGEIPADTQIQFTISTKKRGYLLLVLVDMEGAAKQIYPALAGDELPFGANDELNLVLPNKPVVIPDPRNPLANFEIYATPGKATIIALLSSAPVQIVDLPELSADLADQQSVVSHIFEAVSALQILPRDEKTAGATSNWSMKAVEYQAR